MKEALLITIRDLEIAIRGCGFWEMRREAYLRGELERYERMLEALDESK